MNEIQKQIDMRRQRIKEDQIAIDALEQVAHLLLDGTPETQIQLDLTQGWDTPQEKKQTRSGSRHHRSPVTLKSRIRQVFTSDLEKTWTTKQLHRAGNKLDPPARFLKGSYASELSTGVASGEFLRVGQGLYRANPDWETDTPVDDLWVD